MGFIDAVKDLAQQAGMTVPEDTRSPDEREQAVQHRQRQATLEEVLAKAAENYRRQLKGSPRAIAYLKGRGLSGEIAARYGLGYAPEGWRGLASVFPSYDDPLLEESGLVIAQRADADGDVEAADPPAAEKRYDRFRDRIMFPIRAVQGPVIGFGGRVLDRGEPKYLNSPETPVFVKGRELYGLFEARTAIRQRGYALVVEGYMDVVALAQSGFGNAVATLGTACTAEHVQKLVRFTDAVVFSFDGDAAGRRAAGRALEASLPHANDTRSFRFLFLPTEHDPDSYVRELGAEAFEQRVAAAVPLSKQIVAEAAERAATSPPPKAGRGSWPTSSRSGRALPEGMLKRQLLGEIASRAALATEELASLWRVGGAARAGRRRRRGDRMQAPTGSGGREAPTARAERRRPAAADPPGHPPAARPGRLDAAARKRLVGGAGRRRPRPALRPAGLAWRGVPLHRPRDGRARAAILGGVARAHRHRAVGRGGAGPGRRRRPGDRALARRPAQLDGATARRRPEAGRGPGPRTGRLKGKFRLCEIPAVEENTV